MQAHKKCAIKMIVELEKMVHIQYEGAYKVCAESLCHGYQQDSG